MNTNNLFYNLYNNKDDEELKAIIKDKNYAEDAKLCAIQILRDRNTLLDEFIQIEKELIEKRESRGFNIAQDRYSTGFNRFIALIIDGIVLSIISYTFKLINEVESAFLIGLIGMVELVVPYIYNIVLHSYCGQTLGKMVMNVKIFDISEKKLITFKQALMRDIVPLSLLVVVQVITYFINPEEWGLLVYVSIVVLFLLVFWSLLEIFTMLFNSKRRALHDHIAGTVVLNVNS